MAGALWLPLMVRQVNKEVSTCHACLMGRYVLGVVLAYMKYSCGFVWYVGLPLYDVACLLAIAVNPLMAVPMLVTIVCLGLSAQRVIHT